MRLTTTITIIFLLSSLATSAFAQEKPAKNPERTAVEDFLKKSLESHRENLEVGGLKVRVALVPNYLHIVLAREFLKVDHTKQSPKFLVKRFAELHKKMAKKLSRPGVIARFEHSEAGNRNIMGFEGALPRYVRIVSKGVAKTKHRILPVVTEGAVPSFKKFRLFKPSKSALFSGTSRSTMKVSYNVFSKKSFTIEGVLKKNFSERDTKVAIGVGGFVHFTGRGISGKQIDFSKRARGKIESGGNFSFDLPLAAPEMPKILADLIPKAE